MREDQYTVTRMGETFAISEDAQGLLTLAHELPIGDGVAPAQIKVSGIPRLRDAMRVHLALTATPDEIGPTVFDRAFAERSQRG